MDTSYSITSETLLHGVAGRDVEAERRFYDRYRELVMAVGQASRIRGDDLGELCDEAITAAVLALREGRYDREQGRFKPYFRSIIYKKIQDLRERYVKQARTGSGNGAAFEGVADDAPGPDQVVQDRFDAEWAKLRHAEALEEVMKDSNPVHLQLYLLVDQQDWKPANAARFLSLQPSNAYQILSRIRTDVREALERLCRDER